MINYDSLILLWDYCNFVIVFSNGVPVGLDHSTGKTNALILMLGMKYIPGTSVRLKKMSTVSNQGVLHLPNHLELQMSGIPSRREPDWC